MRCGLSALTCHVKLEALCRWLLVPLIIACSACRSNASGSGGPAPTAQTAGGSAAASQPADPELIACRARIEDAVHSAPLPGAPEFDRLRAEILGRARGQPLIWVREPMATADSEFPPPVRAARRAALRLSAFRRVTSLKRAYRGHPRTLRALLLREGYIYSADPIEALALTSRLELADLFDEEEIYLQRGATVHRLYRKSGRHPRYLHADPPRAGRPAKLLFGDRIVADQRELSDPIHRDLATAAHRAGFDRTRVEHVTPDAVVAQVRFGDTWVHALLETRAARMTLACLDAPAPVRLVVQAWQRDTAVLRRALRRLRDTVTTQVDEAIPFDRPRGETSAERDGQLRPAWRWAYQHGATAFQFEDRTYPVYGVAGHPLPPQMCVDFVLDGYERTAGTWFLPRGMAPLRTAGALDFDRYGIENRRGVLALEQFAETHTDLFEHMRLAPETRVKFRDRKRFFDFLVRHADLFAPGDVVAIQGLKNDGRVHQHAILIEDTDPVTGFPHALADQMRVPRRRTWEAIMAEAPLRSLLFRIRPRRTLLAAMAGEAATANAIRQ